jgi:hypothetical protein
MRIFQEVGRQVEALWRDRNHNEEDFAGIATEVLTRAEIPNRESLDTFYDWMMEDGDFPHQTFYGGFGWEPQITLFNNQRFSIEMLFWLDGTTTIHQHQFEGAFQVFAGSSIHSDYAFEKTDRVNGHLLLGHLRVTRCEMLRKGDIRLIKSGERFLHALFHLDSPSVSLLIRTPPNLEMIPAFSYFLPGIAINYAPYDEPKLARQLKVLKVVAKTAPSTFLQRLKSFLHGADFYGTVRLLGELGAEVVKAGALDDALAIASERHGGARASALGPALAEFLRQQSVVNLRRTITDAEHRLFAAILLNAPDRLAALRLVSQFDAGSSPVERIMDWTRTLAAQNKLGVGFDDFKLEVFSGMLAGMAPKEIAARMHRQSDTHGRGDSIEVICNALAMEPIFQALLREPVPAMVAADPVSDALVQDPKAAAL